MFHGKKHAEGTVAMKTTRSCLVLATSICLVAGVSGQPGPKETPKGSLDIRKGKIVQIDLEGSRIKLLTAEDKNLDLLMTEDSNLGVAGANLKERLRAYKSGDNVSYVAKKKDGKDWLFGMRPGGGGGPRPVLKKFDSSKLLPLDELGDKEYQPGYKGGFYPGGKNQRPADHEAAGVRLAKEVQPLDADGKPDPKGKIVMLSVGMSNTSQASVGFKRVLKSAEGINPQFLFVNGAQGGQTAVVTQYDDKGPGLKYWTVLDQRLKEAGATRAQVQVIWIKQADAGPSQGFPAYAKKLEEELARCVQLLPNRFPNAKLVYLTNRTYGGYAKTPLNPEPYAYESGFAVKWLIERQISGDAALNYDAKKGEVKAPWLSWGPYFWANGSSKRAADGFHYEESDFGADGTHHSAAGSEKIGRLMLQFFRNDSTSRTWFLER